MSELICSIADYCGLKQVRNFLTSLTHFQSQSGFLSYLYLLLDCCSPTPFPSFQLSYLCLFQLPKRLHTVLKSSWKICLGATLSQNKAKAGLQYALESLKDRLMPVRRESRQAKRKSFLLPAPRFKQKAWIRLEVGLPLQKDPNKKCVFTSQRSVLEVICSLLFNKKALTSVPSIYGF